MKKPELSDVKAYIEWAINESVETGDVIVIRPTSTGLCLFEDYQNAIRGRKDLDACGSDEDSNPCFSGPLHNPWYLVLEW